MILSILILRPRQLGNEPLIEELKKLWAKGEPVYVTHKKQTFNMKAMLFCTINNFPAFINLSGYNIKGQLGCLICKEGTQSIKLKYGMKNSYIEHRRWLQKGHIYYRIRKYFNRESDERMASEPLAG